jgi:hypothetical protein
MVIVSDPKMVKEMFSDTTFTGRMRSELFKFDGLGGSGKAAGEWLENNRKFLLYLHSQNPIQYLVHIRLIGFNNACDASIIASDEFRDLSLIGIVNNDGEHWEQLRRFALRHLRDFGFGKSSMEESIMLEVNEFIELLKTEEVGKPVTGIKDRLLFAAVNSVWAIVTGTRYNQNDESLIKMVKQANRYTNISLKTHNQTNDIMEISVVNFFYLQHLQWDVRRWRSSHHVCSLVSQNVS